LWRWRRWQRLRETDQEGAADLDCGRRAQGKFFAIPGEKADGHDFIDAAVKRGASTLVYSRAGDWPQIAASVRVKDVRRALGIWAAHFYRRPSQSLKLVGVTGTNGKTTLTYLVESMLEAAGLSPGVIGTINYRYAGREIPSHHTTPESLDLQQMLAAMVGAGGKSATIEVSSHALAQERVRGLDFDVGVFTNLSRDHLDYHRDMDDYFSAKSRLFTVYLAASSKTNKAAVIYGEDARGATLAAMARAHGLDVWLYGEGSTWDVHPLTAVMEVFGCRGKIAAKGRTVEFESGLIGSANLQNILGAVGVSCALGLEADAIGAEFATSKPFPDASRRLKTSSALPFLPTTRIRRRPREFRHGAAVDPRR
jgi:UDP-N-acetylmuramyl-tripeptide synthetase